MFEVSFSNSRDGFSFTVGDYETLEAAEERAASLARAAAAQYGNRAVTFDLTRTVGGQRQTGTATMIDLDSPDWSAYYFRVYDSQEGDAHDDDY